MNSTRGLRSQRGRNAILQPLTFNSSGVLGWLSTMVTILLMLQSHAWAAKLPNVLFLMADDLNNSLSCYGHPLVKTPNLDRLAERGVRFQRAYCQFPLCGPSRNSLLTGLHPNSTGIRANAQIFRQTIPSHHSLPQAFRLEGYFAARIGKLYHYNVPKSIGTNGHDDPGSWELELNPAGCDRLEEEPHIFSLRPGQFGGTLSWYASPKSDQYHTDGLLAADAEWVLERCAKQKDRPFFLAVGFYRPHTPYVSPKPYFDRYPENQMPVVQGVKEDQADMPAPALGSYKKELVSASRLTMPALRSWMPRSAGCSMHWRDLGLRIIQSSCSPATTAITWASTACGRR